MGKIIISVLGEDHNGVKLEAKGSMLVSEEEYQYFLSDPNEMLGHCDQTDKTVDMICKNAFAEVGSHIDKADDLKRRVERFYSEDGKLRSFSATEFSRGDECHFDDNRNPRQVQKGLHNFLDKAQDMFQKESNQDNQ